ncbi:MAG: hypothetical protein PGN11_21505 [Quadrisphaera sp.]
MEELGDALALGDCAAAGRLAFTWEGATPEAICAASSAASADTARSPPTTSTPCTSEAAAWMASATESGSVLASVSSTGRW